MFNLTKLFSSAKTDYKELLSQGAIILDVRTAAEYQTGHIPGSLNIPLDAIPANLAVLKAKNKPFITVCRSGARSSMAAQVLGKMGMKAYDGGSWRNLEQPARDYARA